MLLRFSAQAWIFCPHVADALNYYLPKVAEWVMAGAFTREMGVHPFVTYPAGFELVETWWVVFFHHDVLIEMAGAEFLVLAFLSVTSLGRHLGLRDAWAGFAAAAYVTTPALHLSALACLNDTPCSAMIVATATLVAARLPLPLIALAAGMGLGIKPSYAYAVPGLVLLGWLLRSQTAEAVLSRRPLPLVAALGMILAGYWYARNLIWFGNPIYPLGSSDAPPAGISPQVGPRLDSFIQNFVSLIDDRIYDASNYSALTDDIAGWGAVAFACGIPGLVWSFREDARFRRLACAFLVSLACMLFLTIHDPWSMKYTSFFPVILVLAGARLAESNLPFRVVMVVAVAFQVLGTMTSFDFPSETFKDMYRRSWRDRSVAALHEVRIGPDIPGIGYFGGRWSGLREPYLVYGPDFSRKVTYLRAADANSLFQAIRASGVSVVYAAPRTPGQELILKSLVVQGLLELREDGLFEVRDSGSPR